MTRTRKTGYRSGVVLPYHPAPDEEREVANIMGVTPDCQPDSTAEALHRMFPAEWWRKFQQAVREIPKVPKEPTK